MSDLKAFTCPTCGAPLTIAGSEMEVICQFCGSRVFVPEELRSKPVTPVAPQPVVAPQVFVVSPYAVPRSEYRPRRGGCSRAVNMLLVLLILIGVVLFRTLGLSNVLVGSISKAVGASNSAGSGAGAVLSGTMGTGPGQFDYLNHFAFDPAGNFYVSEPVTFRIQKFDANGKYVGSWNVDRGNASTGPDGLAVDGAGNVYAIEDYAILKYDGNGKLLGKFTGIRDQYNAGDRFVNMALTSEGSVWAFTWKGDLLHLDAQGKILDRVVKPFSSETETDYAADAWLSELTIGKSGNLYVLISDSYHPKVLVLSPDGKRLLAKFGDGGDTPGLFSRPSSIAVDSQERVYVSEFQRVQVLDSEGHYLRNLPLGVSGVPSPTAMQYDGKGSLYVDIDGRGIYKYDVSSPAVQQ